MVSMTIQSRVMLAGTPREKQAITLQDGLQQQFEGLLILSRQTYRNEARLSTAGHDCLNAGHIHADQVWPSILKCA
jgi:hypothetical protein